MDHTTPQHPSPPKPQHGAVDEAQLRNWLRLRQEMAELHARLEFLKLMVSLGVS